MRDPGPVRNLRYEIWQNDNFTGEYTLLLRWDIPNYNCKYIYVCNIFLMYRLSIVVSQKMKHLFSQLSLSLLEFI